MARRWIAVAGLAALAAFASCGKSSSAACDLTANLCSCNKTSTSSNSCDDYEGKTVEKAKEACTTGTFAQSACPTTGRVGTCKLTVFSDKTYTRYYSDAIASQAACETTNLSFGAVGVAEWTAN